MKKYLSLLLVIVALFMLTGCGTDKDAKLFTESDFEVTLNTGFVKKSIRGIKYYYENNDMQIGVTVNNESKQLFENAGVEFPDDVVGYAEFVVKANNLTDSKVVSKGKYAQFDYKKTVNGKEYYYYGTTHRSGDTYWMINFYCRSEKASEYQDIFAKWANSIVVK